MPELCRFYGIQISMRWNEFGRHNAPHIHAKYGDQKIALNFNGEILAGSISVNKLRLVREWITIHKNELEQAWICAAMQDDIQKIAPLA